MMTGKLKSAFIYSREFLKFDPPQGFPWSVRRTEETYQLCKRLGLLDQKWVTVVSAKPARETDLLNFHEKTYIQILKKANKGVFKEEWLATGIGTNECPVYKGVYDYHRLATGGTLLGADLLIQGKVQIAFNPTGGFHHAGTDFASGFCYLNDIVIAIKKFLNNGLRVLYIDIDAHHGDQVQEAFYDLNKVLAISFHETPKTLFPFKTGFEIEIGKGMGKGYNVNVPLPETTGDKEFLQAFEKIFPPMAKVFRPDAVVAVLGADALFSDPLSHLNLTGTAHSEVTEIITGLSPRLLALGGGGYELENSARTWALEWAVMNGMGCSEDEEALFGGLFWGDGVCSLKDGDRFIPGTVNKKNKYELEKTLRYIEKNVFPIHKL